jgi:hypothetical protein
MIKRNKGNIEYLGMPGVGKTYVLTKNAFVEKNEFQNIPLGKDTEKIKNVMISAKHHPFLVLLIIKYFVVHKLRYKKILIRPYFVIIERLGRLEKINNQLLILDEGVYQFVWRVFSELPINSITKKEMNSLINTLSPFSKNVSYVYGNRKNFASRIIQRNKISSNFDKYVIEGNIKSVLLARSWMYLIVKYLRSNMLIKQTIRNYE